MRHKRRQWVAFVLFATVAAAGDAHADSGVASDTAAPSAGRSARAAAFGDAQPEVTADTSAQFYDVRSPTGETILTRRRVTSTLGVGVYDLLPRPESAPLGPELSFRARLRYDADFGAGGAERDPQSFERFVPGLRGPFDLMYAYVEGRRFFKGWLGFRVGRQYVVDPLGWWSFDGALVRVTSPVYLAAEVYGGLEVRGGLPLSTSRWERDGVWRGDRKGLDPSLYPSLQPAEIAPAFGASVETSGVSWLHGKLTYRRVYNTGSSAASQFTSGLTSPVLYDGARISQERLGYSVEATVAKLLGVHGGFVYDLYMARVPSWFASVDAYAGPKVTISVDYDYYRPTYDADSIWNFFAGEPMNYLALRGSVDATDAVSVSGTAYGRMFLVDVEPINDSPSTNVRPGSDPSVYPTHASSFDGGGHLGARYRLGATTASARASGNFGREGDRVGGDIAAERVIDTRYVVSGRGSVWHWKDTLRPDRDALSTGYVAGVGYRFAPRSSAMLEWQHDMNRLAGHRFRLMLWLNVAVMR